MAPTGPSARIAATGRPPERAQAVWQAAVRLAGDGTDGEATVLALLRSADYDPSTLRHALTLGRTRLRLRPHDARAVRWARPARARHRLARRPRHRRRGRLRPGGHRHRSGAAGHRPRPQGPPRPPGAPGVTTVTGRHYEMADDDLSRQRRKREERLLAQRLPDVPDLTVGDLVADVLAAAEVAANAPNGPGLDVGAYLADRGHEWPTIKTVVDYLERQDAAGSIPTSRRRPLP